MLLHLAQLSRQCSLLEECCTLQGQSSPSSMRSSYLSPSPPISGRDISALAVIRRPSWSGAARTGSYEGSSATTGTLQHAPTGSPLQVRHMPQVAKKLLCCIRVAVSPPLSVTRLNCVYPAGLAYALRRTQLCVAHNLVLLYEGTSAISGNHQHASTGYALHMRFCRYDFCLSSSCNVSARYPSAHVDGNFTATLLF